MVKGTTVVKVSLSKMLTDLHFAPIHANVTKDQHLKLRFQRIDTSLLVCNDFYLRKGVAQLTVRGLLVVGLVLTYI